MVLCLPLVSRKVASGDCGLSPVSMRSGVSTPTTFSSRTVGGSASPVSSVSAWDFQGVDALTSLHLNYDLIDENSRLIGSGASGSVWSARSRVDSSEVAVKTIPKPAYSADVTSETELLRSVQTVRGVVKLVQAFSDADNEIIVMELCEGKDLQCWNNKMTLAQTKHVVFDLLQCLCDVHNVGISHRDVRLENVIAAPSGVEGKMKVTLIDFGSAVGDTAEACIDLHGLATIVSELITGVRCCASEDLCLPGFVPSELVTTDELALDLVTLLMSATRDSREEVSCRALDHAWFRSAS